MTEGPFRKLVNALMAMFSSSVNRVLINLNFAEALLEAVELTDELLFSLITSSCSPPLSDDECVGDDVVRLKLNTVCGMSTSALS